MHVLYYKYLLLVNDAKHIIIADYSVTVICFASKPCASVEIACFK